MGRARNRWAGRLGPGRRRSDGLGPAEPLGRAHAYSTGLTRALRWSAVGAVAAMRVVMWVGRDRHPNCRVPVIGQCDAGWIHLTWPGRAFLGLCVLLVLSVL